jgi:Glycosyl hydrolases family 43
MKEMRILVLCFVLSCSVAGTVRAGKHEPADKASPEGRVAAKPLFRDPVYDGAADPVVIWNRRERRWFMLYTNRRANVPGLGGVAWVHATRIGIAESGDGGATWKYRGTAEIGYGQEDYTHWAPDVVYRGGLYHMFLTVVPGTFTDWQAPREIVHLTSRDLLKWKYESRLKLASDRVIDPSVIQLTDGTWRMWYNNERDRKSIYYADSPDLYAWQDRGKAVGERGEGPKVFRWKNRYWMVIDVWRGLVFYSSDDALKWTRQSKPILEQPGKGADDQVKGGHADAVVSGERAFLFYFTHPGRRNPESKEDGYEQRRSSIQVVELGLKDGEITCDRDEPTRILLRAPRAGSRR